jgi:hypothetical protein
MLNAEVCAKCWQEYYSQLEKADGSWLSQEMFDDRWREGFVYCALAHMILEVGVVDAPDKCPYIVEHTVSKC